MSQKQETSTPAGNKYWKANHMLLTTSFLDLVHDC